MGAIDWNPIQKAEPLKVRKTDNCDARQFWVSGMSEGRDWDARYVEFSGYFGSYGPDVFAAAPDLVTALKAALPFINCKSKQGIAAIRAAQAAIAKAEGRS